MPPCDRCPLVRHLLRHRPEDRDRDGAPGCRLPAYCFTIYHDGEYKEQDIDVEVCEAVVKPCPDSAMVRYKTIPAVPPAAGVLHKGPYSALCNAYVVLCRWIEENGYQPAGPSRDSCIDGIWNKEREEAWLTEIQVPVEEG